MLSFQQYFERSKIKFSSSSWIPFEDNWRKISNSQTVCWNLVKIKSIFQHIFIGRKHKKWQSVQKSFWWFMHPLTVHNPCLCFKNDKYDWFLILYWRTWKPWYYIEGHENPLNLIENAFFLANNREKLSSMLFKRRIIFYSFQLSFLHCSLFLFNFFLGIFIRGRIILHSWKFTFLWEWTTFFSIVPCPCWIK